MDILKTICKSKCFLSTSTITCYFGYKKTCNIDYILKTVFIKIINIHYINQSVIVPDEHEQISRRKGETNLSIVLQILSYNLWLSC